MRGGPSDVDPCCVAPSRCCVFSCIRTLSLTWDVADSKRHQHTCVCIKPAAPTAEHRTHHDKVPLVGGELQRLLPLPSPDSLSTSPPTSDGNGR